MAGSRLSEIRMHGVRWLLTTGWLLIIGSLFFDPFTARFTSPDRGRPAKWCKSLGSAPA